MATSACSHFSKRFESKKALGFVAHLAILQDEVLACKPFCFGACFATLCLRISRIFLRARWALVVAGCLHRVELCLGCRPGSHILVGSFGLRQSGVNAKSFANPSPGQNRQGSSFNACVPLCTGAPAAKLQKLERRSCSFSMPVVEISGRLRRAGKKPVLS